MFDTTHPLHSSYRGPKRPTVKVPGIYAEDMNSTGQKSVKDCRLSASKRPQIRSKTVVRPCGGFVRESMEPQRENSFSKNARRKAARYGRIPR